MKKHYKKIIIYGVIYLILLMGLAFMFEEMFDFTKVDDAANEMGGGSLKEAAGIICNNFRNFTGYVFMYPIYPILYMKDLLFSSWSIAVSINMRGMKETYILLVPHALLEIPNFVIYTYISLVNFMSLWRGKKMTIRKYIGWVWRYRNCYIYCLSLLIIAGIVEGMLTKKIYIILGSG